MTYPITFGKYLLLDRINVGGMAEVFKAKAFGVEGFERILAIKRILPNMADDDEFINMFVDEARIAVQLSHANIVQIYELGKFENQYYIAMEYVSGKDMRQFLDLYRKQKKLLSLPAAAFVISKICEGLDYAHRKTDPSGRPMNVIHRDVSPQNILLSYEGAVKVTDFGIAKAEDRASKTQAGVLKGKFGYMSPEQVRGLEIDHRSDVFAVGILLYEMVTGKRLFIGESDFSTLEKVRNAEVTPPREHNPDIPEELEAVMLKALAKERDERYQWASELADDLQQFLIEDNRIFSAKNLAALLREEYQEDIDAEMAKMEEYMRVQAPPADVLQAAEQQQAVPRAPEGGWNAGSKAEKTMIFDSSFSDLSSAPTQVGESLVDAESTHSGGESSAPASAMPPSVSRVSVVRSRPRPTRAKGGRAGGGSSKRMGAILIAVTAFLSLLVLLVVLFAGGHGTGTIVVTSSPTDQVDVFIDGTLVGSKTPITRNDIPEGEHTLLARAAGYRDKAYRFDLVAGAPAIINVALERDTTRQSVQLKIVTNPPGASVRIGGLPQGVTPLTLKGQDPTRPLIIELAKAGYTTETVTYTFKPGQVVQQLQHTLKPAAGGGAAAAKGSAGGSASPQQVARANGTLQVRSEPSGAMVFLGHTKKGLTPVDITDLDTTTSYTLEVTKSGFRPYHETVRFDGQPTATVTAQLQQSPPARASRHKASGSRSRGGGHGSHGGCSGSGAKLSVMAIGAQDCKVVVGHTKLGVAPIFKKDAPVGHCAIRVTCGGGKSYRTTKVLKAGASDKVIIKSNDWK